MFLFLYNGKGKGLEGDMNSFCYVACSRDVWFEMTKTDDELDL
jgi:hypothetical protein